MTCAGSLTSRLPVSSTTTCSPMFVCCRLTSSRIPMRPSTPMCASPRKSTAKPPSRNDGARSTTVVSKPYLLSQNASAGPAMLAPEMRIFLFFICLLLPEHLVEAGPVTATLQPPWPYYTYVLYECIVQTYKIMVMFFYGTSGATLGGG